MKSFVTHTLMFIFGAIVMYIGLWIQAGLSFIEAVQKMNGGL